MGYIMTIKLGIVMDPISQIKPHKDTSLALLLAAQTLDCQLYYMEPTSLYLQDGIAMAQMKTLTVDDDDKQWFQFTGQSNQALSSLDIILMRQDPPMTNEFVYVTHLLEIAQQQGVKVVNRPQSLRDCNEKLFATHFPQCCPPHIVTSKAQQLNEFIAQQHDVILKPLDGMGGTSIFRITENDPNTNVIIETITQYGTQTIMAQRYLPEIMEGDKRIWMINGEPLDYCLARIPSAGETRGNLAAGGFGKVQALSDRDRWIAQQVSQQLKARGLFFVGLDVIGDYLTEINVTSPTCLREIAKATDPKLPITIMQQLLDTLKI